jgi:hypothetical protein
MTTRAQHTAALHRQADLVARQLAAETADLPNKDAHLVITAGLREAARSIPRWRRKHFYGGLYEVAWAVRAQLRQNRARVPTFATSPHYVPLQDRPARC